MAPAAAAPQCLPSMLASAPVVVRAQCAAAAATGGIDLPYYRRRRGGFSRRSSGFSSGGTFYGSAASANYEIKRHIIEDTYTLPRDRSIVVPLLAYAHENFGQKQLITDYDGTAQEAYVSVGVKAGSVVRGMNLDILVKPATASDADVIDFYTARIVCSYHDIKSDQVRGVQIDSNGIPGYQNDAKNLASAPSNFTTTHVNSPPNLDFDINKFYLTPTLRHWWRGVRKTTMAAGQPAQYRKWERTPRKCVRSNPGMFWGMVFMNDSASTIEIDFKSRFQEIPLIQ